MEGDGRPVSWHKLNEDRMQQAVALVEGLETRESFLADLIGDATSHA